MQVEHKTEKGTVIFDLLPKDAFDIRIRFNKFLTYRQPGLTHVELFNEGIIAIGLTSEVTEDQCQWFMRIDNFKGYDNFVTGEIEESALNSFRSLIKFKGIKQPSLVLFKVK